MKPQHPCRHCKEKFTTEEELSKHVSAAHINSLTIYTCEICQRQFQYKGSYTDHLKKHVKEDVRYECTECPCFFKNLGHLKSHIKDVHGPKTKVYYCKDCSKQFYSKASISQHMHKAHASVQAMHKCTFCQRIYGSRNSLKWHIHINHNKDFVRSKCPYCPSDFKWPHHLKVHIKKVHIEKGHAPTDLLKKGLSSIRRKTNDCVVCDEKFDKKLHLMLHLQSVHKQEIDIYKCCRCSAVFTLKDSLKFHLDEHRKKDPASGNHCCHQCHPESNPMLYKEAKTEVDEKDGRTEIEKEVIDFELTLMEDEDIRRLIRYRLKHTKRKHSTDQEIVIKETGHKELEFNGIRSSDNVSSENGIDSLGSTSNVVDAANGGTFNGTIDKVAKICLERTTDEELALKAMDCTKQCNICKNKFKLQHSLNEHRKLCHKAKNVLVKNVSNDAPGMSEQVSNEREHLEVGPKAKAKITRSKIYKCKYCKEKFKKPINLGRHVRLVHGVRKITPLVATKTHKDKQDISIKRNKKPTSITYYGYAEAAKAPAKPRLGMAEVKRVKMKTETQKLYECGKCVLYFKSKLELLRHISNIHMGIRPNSSDSYFCDYCNSKFATKAEISEHLKNH